MKIIKRKIIHKPFSRTSNKDKRETISFYSAQTRLQLQSICLIDLLNQTDQYTHVIKLEWIKCYMEFSTRGKFSFGF